MNLFLIIVSLLIVLAEVGLQRMTKTPMTDLRHRLGLNFSKGGFPDPVTSPIYDRLAESVLDLSDDCNVASK